MSKFEKRVVDRIEDRAQKGLDTYGVSMERGDLSLQEWLQHLQDELLDAAVYVEKLKEEVEELERYRAENIQ
tara:strand:- start:4058 stop:4273 length:216 start_codon:yes stop_codon:yes gene_type:complete